MNPGDVMAWYDPSQLISAVKSAGPPIYLGAFIASTALLFFPDALVAQLPVGEVRREYKLALTLTFFASLSLLIGHAWVAVAPWVTKKIQNLGYKRRIRWHLRGLTEAEKVFLRPYIDDGENTVRASVYDGVANGLSNKDILYHSSNMTIPGVPGMLMPYNLQPIPRQYLTRKRWMLDHPAVAPDMIPRWVYFWR
jgi:hypothetical protein